MAETLLFAVIGVVLLNGLMYLKQPDMIFYPTSPLVETPADWGLEYEDVSFETEDGHRLHGWHIPRPGSDKTLLFFHGNAGNISHRGESVRIFHRLGLNVLIFDYRGYGKSEGAPSEQGLYRDASAAWRHLTGDRGLRPYDIVLFGRSLGGAVAAELASRVEAGAVILESSFSSARDVAHSVFPLLSRLVVLRFEFPAASHLRQARSPVLVLHSAEDEIIPYSAGRRLFDAAPDPKRFFDLRGDHNGGFLQSQPAYEEALGEFLSSYAGSRANGREG